MTFCADLARDLHEDAAGSAPKAASWLLLEQPGPWGRDAVGQSDLDPAVAGALQAAADSHGFRVGLLRRSARRQPPGPRACFLLSTRRGAEWMERHTLARAHEVLDLDLAALGAGASAAPGARTDEPLLAVCTHGRRDACCARLGRPLARALAAAHPDHTWQCSHVGGHRFAPTFLVFPLGLCFGRVPAARAREVAADALRGRIALEHLRGRAGDSPFQQAADVLARRALALDGIADVIPGEPRPDAEGARVTLQLDGRGTYEAHVAWRPTGVPRPASCGDEPGDPGAVHLLDLRAAA